MGEDRISRYPKPVAPASYFFGADRLLETQPLIYRDLRGHFRRKTLSDSQRTNRHKLLLGTASWGNRYGILNSTHVQNDDVPKILKLALDAGIKGIDTAPGYGGSEVVLGCSDLRPFDVHTKIDSSTWARGSDAADAQFQASIKSLGVSVVKGLTFHSAHAFLSSSFRALAFITRLRNEGFIKTWGISVYSPEEAYSVMRSASPDYIQAPVNIVDRRFLNEMLVGRLLDAGIGLQARSIFLQGLLLSDEESLPIQFNELQPLISEYSVAAKERGISQFELALRFVNESTAVQGVVVGVNEESHVQQLISSTQEQFETLSLEGLSYSDKVEIIDPRSWRP